MDEKRKADPIINKLLEAEMRKPELTATLNCKVTPAVRSVVEDIATSRGLSLGEATRYLSDIGIKHQAAVA